MIPPISIEPSTISIGALLPAYAGSSSSMTATAESPAISRVTRPSASVTTSRVRVRQPVAEEYADGGSEEDGRDVDEGADTREHGPPLPRRET